MYSEILSLATLPQNVELKSLPYKLMSVGDTAGADSQQTRAASPQSMDSLKG